MIETDLSATSLLLILLLSGVLTGLLSLAGVALGGTLVFRTRRDSHESLFQFKKPQGAAFTVDPFEEEGGQPMRGKVFPQKEEDAVPGILDAQTSRFLEQIKHEKAVVDKGKAEGKETEVKA